LRMLGFDTLYQTSTKIRCYDISSGERRTLLTRIGGLPRSQVHTATTRHRLAPADCRRSADLFRLVAFQRCVHATTC
jgi:hypothetical protein